MQAAAQSTLIGATIGNYRVMQKLGEGGMGSVYLAEHPLIGKKVALKVLHEEYSSNPEVVNRFFTEAKAVNDIGHPNIVDIVDFGHVQPEGGAPFVYFIMEFLAGESLASLLAREAPLSPERALHIAIQVADALSASHAKGIVHRDLKPDNIFLLQRGRERDFVKVLDFGIAKLTSGSSGSAKTRTGIVMGTPAYMSPEQCEGRGHIDHRADIYALGIVLYEMITGRVPFVGEGYGEILVQHLTKQPPLPSTIRGAIPPHVEAVVMRALCKNRDNRYPSMDEFIAAMKDPQGFVEANGGLDAFYAELAPTNVRAQPTRAMTPPSSASAEAVSRPTTLSGSGAGELADDAVPPRSRTTVIATSAIGALVVLGGIGYAIWGGGGAGDRMSAAAADRASAAAPAAAPARPLEAVAPAPAAPTPAPAAADGKDAPVSAKTVTITATSDPSGAQVFVGSETVPRGTTPVDLTFAAGPEEVELTFKLDGFKERKKTIRALKDAVVDVTLDRDRPTRPATAATKAGSATKSGGGDKKTGDKKPASTDDVLAPSF